MVQAIQQQWSSSQNQPLVVIKVNKQYTINFVSIDKTVLLELISSNLFIIFVNDLEET